MKLKKIFIIVTLLVFISLYYKSVSIYFNRYYPYEEYLDKIEGAWLGQMIGLTFGEHFRLRWQNQMVPFEIKNFLRIKTDIVIEMNKKLRQTGGRNWTNIQHQYIDQHENWEIYKPQMVPDKEELFIDLMFLYTFSQNPLSSLETKQFANDWLKYLNFNRIWHANRSAFANFQKEILPPESGLLSNNPHANDMDFQASADIIGLSCPGLPQVSHFWCSQIGSLTCSEDGIYGGMYIAGMYTVSFFENKIDSVVSWGLRCIPENSNYARAIRDVLKLSHKYEDWQTVWQKITDRWSEDETCPQGKNLPLNMSAILNGAYVTIGLIYGDGNLGKTLEVVTRCGQNSDSNASSAAGIIGCMLGANQIPQQFKNSVKDMIPNYSIKEIYPTHIKLKDIVNSNANVGIKILRENGGKFIKLFGEEKLIIPNQQPIFEIN